MISKLVVINRISLLAVLLFLYLKAPSQNVADFCIHIAPNIYAYDVVETSNGEYIVAGKKMGAPLDGLVSRINSNGTVVWSGRIDGGYDDYCYGICESASGTFVITGTTQGATNGYGLLLAEIDGSGNLLKSRKINYSIQPVGFSIVRTGTNGFAVTGLIGGYFFYFALFDSNLNHIITQRGDYEAIGNSIILTQDSGFAIAGERQGASTVDGYLVKMDASGAVQWTRRLPGTPTIQAYSVIQTDSGDYILCGTKTTTISNWDIFLAKISSIGKLMWFKTFIAVGSSDEAMSLVKTHDSGYAVTGKIENSRFIMKFDQNDSLQWSYEYNAPFIYSQHILETNDHGFVITGSQFLMKTDSMGVNCCAVPALFPVDTSGSTTTGGSFITMSPTQIDTTPIFFPGSIFSTVDCITLATPETEHVNGEPVITPNPSNGKFQIIFSNHIPEGSVEIYNLQGQKVFEEIVFGAAKKEINLRNIAVGIYFAKIFDGEKFYCKKIIIEHN